MEEWRVCQHFTHHPQRQARRQPLGKKMVRFVLPKEGVWHFPSVILSANEGPYP
jgi:hypothetical protein